MHSNFTGLLLVTGESAPNIESEILETLSPFVITILDKQSMDIRGRYFLAIHFSLDKAHAKAIEKDLLNTAAKIGVDLVVDYQ
ncbi:MAG: hypothetical protein EBY00_01110 [Actinobacteria bacterium]|jgi:predicted amino acid-binding ACT domain protein|nr:hypothetical protein [Actinomycetota bacterium]